MTAPPDPAPDFPELRQTIRRDLHPADWHSWFWTWCVVCAVAGCFLLRNLVRVPDDPLFGSSRAHYFGWPIHWMATNVYSGILPPLKVFVDWGVVCINAIIAAYFTGCAGILTDCWQRSAHPTAKRREQVLLALCGVLLMQHATLQVSIWLDHYEGFFIVELLMWGLVGMALLILAAFQLMLLAWDQRARPVESINQYRAAETSPANESVAESET